MYQTHEHGEIAIYLLGNLEEVLDIYHGYHENFSGIIYEAWFDFATRKVLDVKKVKRAYLKTGVLTICDKPPTDTLSVQPENSLEFADFDEPNPMARAQALFDHLDNRKLLDECETELSKASPMTKGKMTTYNLTPVIDIAVVNPDLLGPDDAEPVAGEIYRVKFNLATWKVLSFKQLPQNEEGMAEDLRLDPPSEKVAIMEIDENIPEEATRDLAGMQRFFDDPARNANFDELGWLLKEVQKAKENVA